MEEKVCKNCGAILKEEDEYCENCGAKVDIEELSDEEFKESITRDTTLQKELNEETEQLQSRFTPEYQAFLAKMEEDEKNKEVQTKMVEEETVQSNPLPQSDLKLVEEPKEKKKKVPTWVWIVCGIILLVLIVLLILKLTKKI